MKRKIIALFLAVATVVSMMAVPASAAAAEADSTGMYDLKTVAMNAVLTPQLADNTAVAPKTASIKGVEHEFYPEAVRFGLEFQGEANGMYFVAVCKGDLDAFSFVPMPVYTNQYNADASGKVSVSDKTGPYPTSLETGVYTVFANGTKIANFSYYVPKAIQADFKFAEGVVSKSYTDGDFTVAATGAVTGSAVTYTSSKPAVAAVDSATGKVSIKGVGETVITAVAAETEEYAKATASYKLTVAKGAVVITAKDQKICVNDEVPALGKDSYTVTGLRAGEKLTAEPQIKYAAEPDNTKEGTVDILVSDASAGDNYTITYQKGVLTISAQKIQVEQADKGQITVSPENPKTGATVTVTVQPKEGYELDQVIVTDGQGSQVQVEQKDNQATFVMPDSPVTVKASFLMENPFTDVVKGAWYYRSVLWAVENKITSGMTTTEFGTFAACNRAQIVTFLWSAAGKPEPKTTENPFTDVKESHFFYKPVLWAVENGITGGMSKTEFGPTATCNRAQAVTFLYKFMKQPKASTELQFTDVKEGSWYYKPVQWAVENGITGGMSKTEFGTLADCLRSQIVTFMYKTPNIMG